MGDNIVGTYADHRRPMRLAMPSKICQASSRMFDVWTVIAQKDDDKSRSAFEISETDRFAACIRQAEIRRRRSKRQHR
jgi:hypothetical protein